MTMAKGGGIKANVASAGSAAASAAAPVAVAAPMPTNADLVAENVAEKFDMDQVRRDVERLPGRWSREGDIVVCHSVGSASRRQVLARIAAEESSKGEPCLVVDGNRSNSGPIVKKLRAAGYHAVSGTVES